jgi:hypothetical protein
MKFVQKISQCEHEIEDFQLTKLETMESYHRGASFSCKNYFDSSIVVLIRREYVKEIERERERESRSKIMYPNLQNCIANPLTRVGLNNVHG